MKEYFSQAKTAVQTLIDQGASPEAIHSCIAEWMIAGALEALPEIDWEAHDDFWDSLLIPPLTRVGMTEENRYTR